MIIVNNLYLLLDYCVIEGFGAQSDKKPAETTAAKEGLLQFCLKYPFKKKIEANMLLQFQKKGKKSQIKKTFYSACFTAAAVAVHS